MYLNFQDFYKNYLNLKDFIIKEDDNIFYLWKVSWIPSSFGKEKSVLNLLEEKKIDDNFTKNQLNNFLREQEYWLLNRLDNDTSWFLYFAKNKDIYNNFKELQKNEQIEKVYYAMVETKNLKNKKMIIDFPIMHKNKTKMIVIKSKNDEKKWRWKKHFVKTQVEFLEKQWEFAWLKIIIKKWIRHQIRLHLSSIWYPIVWDKLYWWEKADKLYLFSVGINS